MQEILNTLPPWLQGISDHHYLAAGILVIATIVIAKLASWIITATLKAVTGKTATTVDDELIAQLHRPIFLSILFLGLAMATLVAQLPADLTSFVLQIIKTLAIVVWTLFAIRAARILLNWRARHPQSDGMVRPKTLPVFQNLALVLLIALSLYLIFMVWKLDMTAWLASAGVLGIAIGFAAKDTLANLFSGIFILADAPYQIGDFVVLDTGERGEVTHIGLRSTRMLTRDDVEITVPNSIMGNTKIINESGGPYEKYRIRVEVGVAYGTQIDPVRSALLEIAIANPEVCQDPGPRVRFTSFGASSLDLVLLCWVEQPMLRGHVLDALNEAIYNRFMELNIEIPYAKQDLYLKEWPDRPS